MNSPSGAGTAYQRRDSLPQLCGGSPQTQALDASPDLFRGDRDQVAVPPRIQQLHQAPIVAQRDDELAVVETAARPVVESLNKVARVVRRHGFDEGHHL